MESKYLRGSSGIYRGELNIQSRVDQAQRTHPTPPSSISDE